MGKIRKRKSRKKTLILVALLFGLIIAVGVGVYKSRPSQSPPSPQTYTAEEYFRIVNATIDDANPRYNEAHTEMIAVEIYTISFKLQAFKGDATNVVVQSWARAEPEELGTILKNEYKAVVQQRTPQNAPYFSERNEDGKFPMKIRITSTQASGYITIYF